MRLRRGLGRRRSTAGAAAEAYRTSRRSCCPISIRSGSCSTSSEREGKRILFEGAQGALLDIDHGTYPFVTSSNTVAAQAATGSGLGPGAIGYVLGICQGLHHARRRRAVSRPSWTTRSARLLGERGHEFGTVTGRPRRCGWFDAVLVRQSVQASAASMASRLTKLDILDGFDEIEGLRRLSAGRHASSITCRPAHDAQAAVRADLRGASKAGARRPRGARSWADLPAQAIKYVRRIEELIEAPVALLSTSPEREDTILVHDPFQD